MQPTKDKLRNVMSLVRELLKNADVAGYVVLYEDHHSEYMLQVDPSWSCLIPLPDGKVRFRSKTADYHGDLVRWKREQEQTLGMIKHFEEVALQNSLAFMQLYQRLNKHIDIEHTEGTMEHHEPDPFPPTKH